MAVGKVWKKLSPKEGGVEKKCGASESVEPGNQTLDLSYARQESVAAHYGYCFTK